MDNDSNATTETSGESTARLDATGRAIEVPEEVAQALHRILSRLWNWPNQHPFSHSSFVEARDALWYWFRTGRLRVCRDGNADVLGVVENYRLLRIREGEVVRFAIEVSNGERCYQDDVDDAIEEMACILNWHYLLFCEPEDPSAAGSPFLPEIVRSLVGGDAGADLVVTED
jgi:hypothetical protein